MDSSNFFSLKSSGSYQFGWPFTRETAQLLERWLKASWESWDTVQFGCLWDTIQLRFRTVQKSHESGCPTGRQFQTLLHRWCWSTKNLEAFQFAQSIFLFSHITQTIFGLVLLKQFLSALFNLTVASGTSVFWVASGNYLNFCDSSAPCVACVSCVTVSGTK